jgi:hypothetical protein
VPTGSGSFRVLLTAPASAGPLLQQSTEPSSNVPILGEDPRTPSPRSASVVQLSKVAQHLAAGDHTAPGPSLPPGSGVRFCEPPWR